MAISTEFLTSAKFAVNLYQQEAQQKAEQKAKEDEQAHQIALKQVMLDEERRRQMFAAELEKQQKQEEKEALEASQFEDLSRIMEVNKANGWGIVEEIDSETQKVIGFNVDPNAKMPVNPDGTSPDFLTLIGGKVVARKMGGAKADKKEYSIYSGMANLGVDPARDDIFWIPTSEDVTRSEIAEQAGTRALQPGTDIEVIHWRKDKDSQIIGLKKLLTFGFGPNGHIERLQRERDNERPDNYNAYRDILTGTYMRLMKDPEFQSKVKSGKDDAQVTRPLLYLLMSGDYPLLEKADEATIEAMLMEGINSSMDIDAKSISAQIGGTSTGPDPVITPEGDVIIPGGTYDNLRSWAKGPTGGIAPEVASQLNNIAHAGGTVPEKVYAAFNKLPATEARDVLEQIKKSREHFSIGGNSPFTVDRRGVLIADKNKLYAPTAKTGTVLAKFGADPEVQMAVASAMFGGSVIQGFPGEYDATYGAGPASTVATSLLGPKVVDAIATREMGAGGIIEDVKLLKGLMDLTDENGDFLVSGGVSGKSVVLTEGIYSQFTSLLNEVGTVLNDVDSGNDRFGNAFSTELDTKNRAQFQNDVQDSLAVLKGGKTVSKGQFEKMFRAVAQGLLYKVASALQGGDFRNISDYDVKLAIDRMGELTKNFTNIRSAWGVLSQLQNEAMRIREINEGLRSNNINDVAAAAVVYRSTGYASIAEYKNWLTAFVDSRIGGVSASASDSKSVIDESVPLAGDGNESVPLAGDVNKSSSLAIYTEYINTGRTALPKDAFFPKGTNSMSEQQRSIYDSLVTVGAKILFLQTGSYLDENGAYNVPNIK